MLRIRHCNEAGDLDQKRIGLAKIAALLEGAWVYGKTQRPLANIFFLSILLLNAACNSFTQLLRKFSLVVHLPVLCKQAGAAMQSGTRDEIAARCSMR